MRLPAHSNGAELGMARTLEGLTEPAWSHGPSSTSGGQELPNSQPFSSQRRVAGEVSQRPASSLKAESSCRSGPACRGHKGRSVGTSQENHPAAASEESMKNRLPGRHSFSYSIGCQVLGQLRPRELGQVLSASPGPTSRSDG